MATEYGFVHDATGEAYDLGRGPWYEWTVGRLHTYDDRLGLPRTREDVRALLDYWMAGWSLGRQPTWASAVEDAIWAFLQNHPDARVVNDDDHLWTLDPSPADPCFHAYACVYRQVGSVNDHESLIVKPAR